MDVPLHPARLLNSEEYSKTALELEASIFCHHIHSTLCYSLQGRFKAGEIELRLWRVDTLDNNSLDDEKLGRESPECCGMSAFAFAQILLGKQIVFHVAATTADPDFIRRAISSLLQVSAEAWSKFDKVMCLHLREDIKAEMQHYLTTQTRHSQIPHDVPVCGFYSTPNQIQLLLSTPLPSIPLEYEFTSLSDQHARQLCTQHIYTTAKDEPIIGVRLRNWPSVGIKAKNGVIVSHECLDPTGSISMQYTAEEHRRRGLGTAVEWRICQRKVEETQTRPWKGVSATMFDVLRRTHNSPLWTPILRDKDIPWHFHYTMFSVS